MDRSTDDKENYENNKKDMPLKDKLFLSPIEKYKFYGRFPWKMFIHLLLVILSTTQVNKFNYIKFNIISYFKNQKINKNKKFQ